MAQTQFDHLQCKHQNRDAEANAQRPRAIGRKEWFEEYRKENHMNQTNAMRRLIEEGLETVEGEDDPPAPDDPGIFTNTDAWLDDKIQDYGSVALLTSVAVAVSIRFNYYQFLWSVSTVSPCSIIGDGVCLARGRVFGRRDCAIGPNPTFQFT